MKQIELRNCKIHGIVKHTNSNGKRWRCNKCASASVQKRREKVKLIAIDYKGCKCAICGYDKCVSALEFHHTSKDDKEFNISSKGYTKSWDVIKSELDKCILVCSNCHREIHYEDEKNTNDYKEVLMCGLSKENDYKIQPNICIDCGVVLSNSRAKRCVSCSRKHSRKCERPTKEELYEMIKTESFVNIGKKYGVSDNAIRKWCKGYEIKIVKVASR